MKLFIGLLILGTGTVFLAPKQKNITGTWVLDTNEKCEAAVLRIQLVEGYYAANLDMPDQQVYDKPVAVQVARDSIKIWLDDAKKCFIKAAVCDSVFVGKSFVDEKAMQVKFHKANN